MYFLYNILILVAGFVLKIAALFNKKIKLFIDGRKQTFFELQQGISEMDEVIWVHCASLGEFEQGRPIIEKLKLKFPTKKVVLTFFSPSGYEVRKNYEYADVICYLPLDTSQNAKKFLKIVHPKLAIFVKYEFWPNFLKELKKNNVETLLISGIFRKNQPFFNWYGGFMRKSLTTFAHFFVQDENSKQL
ncbi:3-deoxy-D-manno-octulosonic acid transferase, partial [Candidatus Bathyarchaeota archaeon]|nr:3-deoxy-D-manno-octulosonic acid transferase [Candidatus Bathyarchaeota archaeon]